MTALLHPDTCAVDLDALLSDALGCEVVLALEWVPAGVSAPDHARIVREELWAAHVPELPLPTTWPHARLSSSHTRHTVAVLLSLGSSEGVGVDIEDAGRLIDPRAARFFLTDTERAEGPDLLTSWTLKEALYKADPNNRGRHLACYELDTTSAPQRARGVLDRRVFSCTSVTISGLRLSVAHTSLKGTP